MERHPLQCLSLLVLAAALFVPTAATAQWQAGPGALVPVAQNGVVADPQGRIYNINGKAQFGPVLAGLDCVHRYDYCTDTWEEMPSNGWSTYGVSPVLHSDGFIYMTGGATGRPGLTLQLNTNTGYWVELADAPTAGNSFEVVMISDPISGLIHRIGGEDWATEHLVFNPVANSWSTAASPIIPVFGGVGAFDPASGDLIVIGGWSGNSQVTGAASSVVQRYDPDTNSWSIGASMPGARFAHDGDIGPDGIIYVWGGSTNYFDGGAPIFNTLFAYNPSTNSWSSIADPNPQGANRELGATPA